MNSHSNELRQRKAILAEGGGKDRIDKQHTLGKKTARERMDLLYDPGSFMELLPFTNHRCVSLGMAGKDLPGDGVVVGYGGVQGRLVYAYSQDFTVAGGSAGEMHCNKIVESMQAALKYGCPFVGFMDSGGARIQEGVLSLSGYGKVFYNNVLLSGVVPQIAVIAGPCAGGAAYSPALMDWVIMVKGTSKMFITGPEVVREVTGEVIDAEDLGGAYAHASRSGVAHFVVDSDEEAVLLVQNLLSFWPSNNMDDPPRMAPRPEVLTDDPRMARILPDNPKEAYDMRDVIRCLVDDGYLLEVSAHYAKNIIVGFARIDGSTVGVIANQPNYLAGVLDIDSSDKGARFIRFCNVFNIPLINLVDVPGFLPGVAQEHGGIIRHGAKMLYAYASATVPKITVIIRKAYGGAYLAMCSKDMGADLVLSWPDTEIAVMGAEGAVKIIYRNELNDAADPVKVKEDFIKKYTNEFASPYVAASLNMVDDIIEPEQTRRIVAAALRAFHTKRVVRHNKKHGNIPL